MSQETGVHQNVRVGQFLELVVSIGAITHLFFFGFENRKYPHELEVSAGLCLLLIVLIVFNPASITRRIIRQIVHIVEPDPFIAWFVERDAARPDMQRVWKTKAYLAFVGLSHRSLATYLGEELSSGRSVPWESIDIFFASDKAGAIYEGAEFTSNIRRNRQLIAATVTEALNLGQLAKLKQFRFRQMDTGGAEYTGSAFGKSRKDPEVFYVVLSSPGPRGETKKALTFRVDRDGTENWNLAHRAVLEHYEAGFNRLEKTSRSLGTFRPSMWDQSASEWSAFCAASPLMSQEMRGLIEFAGPVKGRDVLDLGCATGELSKLLIQADASKVFALDQSPQMLRLAKHQLGDATNVHYALCSVPTRDREDIDLEGHRFHLIFLHQALPAIACDMSSLAALARWCLAHLESGGKVALAAHDSVVGLDDQRWEDPFRTHLKVLASRDPHFADKLRTPRPKFRKEDIVDSFVDAGFRLDRFELKTIQNTMAERAIMWCVPAVLDSFVDVNDVGLDEARLLSREAAELVKGQATKDRVLGYWTFAAS